MSSRGGRRNFRNNNRDSNVKQLQAETVDSTNPVINQFQLYSAELDDKHDRHERLVKLSRDVTIESKRIIFLLHNIDARWAYPWKFKFTINTGDHGISL